VELTLGGGVWISGSERTRYDHNEVRTLILNEIKPIRGETDYEAALAAVERLWGARSGTPEGNRLDVLATLIDAYESEHHPIAARPYTMILIEEVPDGGYGRADEVFVIPAAYRAKN
jgi:hypothetical protein